MDVQRPYREGNGVDVGVLEQSGFPESDSTQGSAKFKQSGWRMPMALAGLP